MATKELLQAIAVTAELTNTQLSEPAARVMAADLSAYPESQVMKALTRCRRELKGRLTIADVITRLDDGRPGVEEAWAMIPRDEAATVVWTDEMAKAWGVARPLLEMGEDVAARMAFKEHYGAAVQRARDERKPVCWMASLGHDAHGRASALLAAVQEGKLLAEQVTHLLPYHDSPETLALLGAVETKLLAAA